MAYPPQKRILITAGRFKGRSLSVIAEDANGVRAQLVPGSNLGGTINLPRKSRTGVSYFVEMVPDMLPPEANVAHLRPLLQASPYCVGNSMPLVRRLS